MYTAFIIGGGKQLRAKSLGEIFTQLQRERIQVPAPEQKRASITLAKRRDVIIRASRKLTQSQMMQRHIRRPFRPMEKSEEIQVRIRRDREETIDG